MSSSSRRHCGRPGQEGGRSQMSLPLPAVTASKWGLSLQCPASATTTVVPALARWCGCLSPALEGDLWFPTISNFWVASLPPLASQPLPSLIALISCMKPLPPSPPSPPCFKHSDWFLFSCWYLTNTLGKEIERKWPIWVFWDALDRAFSEDLRLNSEGRKQARHIWGKEFQEEGFSAKALRLRWRTAKRLLRPGRNWGRGWSEGKEAQLGKWQGDTSCEAV